MADEIIDLQEQRRARLRAEWGAQLDERIASVTYGANATECTTRDLAAEIAAWRQQHPIRAWFHDHGIRDDELIGRLDERRAYAERRAEEFRRYAEILALPEVRGQVPADKLSDAALLAEAERLGPGTMCLDTADGLRRRHVILELWRRGERRPAVH